jgi:sialate O-acetylesterase
MPSITRFLLLPALCALTGLASAADVPALRLAHVFSDHGVLQRGQPLPVWGWAEPGAAITATLAGQTQTAVAAADGRWQVAFAALQPGPAAVDLVVTSGAAKVGASDLLVGEVWICSGQSNMGLPTSAAQHATAEIAAATHPRIRLLHVGNISSATPVADIAQTWTVCSPETVGSFSAVGYFFGRDLHQAFDVPIGLIESDWGGTPAESWTSYPVLAADPQLAGLARFYDAALAGYPAAKAAYDEAVAKGRAPTEHADETGWEKPDLDTAAWKPMEQPRRFEDAGLVIDGVVWFRRTVEIPAAVAGRDLVLTLGPIDDSDRTAWDGEPVGETAGWNVDRSYAIPARLATAGRHVIAVRVLDTGGFGGIWGRPEQLALKPAAGGEAIGLAGTWLYRVAEAIPSPPAAPMGPGHPWLPSGLRNGMITPLIPYAIRGVIWYQGESNANRAWQYRTLLPALIRDWRSAWGQGDFPFYIVQLANFTPAPAEPGESDWAELRDAQLNTLRTVPATGLASAIDIGDAKDIHPTDKQEVGRRLSLWAIAAADGGKTECSGPLYAGATVEGSRVRVRFDHLGGGLVAKGGPLTRFAIAGADRTWVWADAVIDGDTVVVSSPAVPAPVAVRYAWANNPAGCNLVNRAGLPASPFRSDDWPLTTVGR